MKLLLILCFVAYATAVTCPAAQASHFCETSPIPSTCTACTRMPPTCTPNNIKFDKSNMTYLRYRASPACCCAEVCLVDVEDTPCDGVEYTSDGKCHLVTAVHSEQWSFPLQKTVNPVYLKTYKCNGPSPTKTDLSLTPLTGRGSTMHHTIGNPLNQREISKTNIPRYDFSIYACYAKTDLAQCDLVPLGTDADFRELIVDGDIDAFLGYCSRTKGLCGATETLKMFNSTRRYDKMYRAAGFDSDYLYSLGFKDRGAVPCYFWPNKDGLNC